MDSIRDRESAIAQMAGSEEDLAQLREHLQGIVGSDAFSGSERCKRFLAYIVNQAVAGHFESLKERVIGVEVFGRSPAYDTSEDAIVRVTASDVRKRLRLHYRKDGAVSRFHITLPVGSYVPEIICDAPADVNGFASHTPRQTHPPIPLSFIAVRENSAPAELAAQDPPATSHAASGSEAVRSTDSSDSRMRTFAVVLAVLAALLAALNLAQWNTVRKDASRAKAAAVSVLPWSPLFRSANPTHLVTSDPEIVTIQQIIARRLSLFDYVNRNYMPENTSLTPGMRQVLATAPQEDWVAPGDARIAVHIAELAQKSGREISVQAASKTRVSDLKTDDNFIFLGSPRSDPWVSLFNDRLDFQFSAIGDSQAELIRDVRPKPGEQPVYAPTRGTTGASYAIVAFVPNPGQAGQVLLIAGATGEGTDVAGRFVTDLPRLSMELQKCGIPPSGPLRHFEMLLRVNVMAGTSLGYDVMACHILPVTAVR